MAGRGRRNNEKKDYVQVEEKNIQLECVVPFYIFDIKWMPLNTLTFCNITKWTYCIEQSIQIDHLWKRQGSISPNPTRRIDSLKDQKMIDHCSNFPASLPTCSSISYIFLKQGSDHVNLLLKNLPELPAYSPTEMQTLIQGLNENSSAMHPNSHFHPISPLCFCEAKAQPN